MEGHGLCASGRVEDLCVAEFARLGSLTLDELLEFLMWCECGGVGGCMDGCLQVFDHGVSQERSSRRTEITVLYDLAESLGPECIVLFRDACEVSRL